MSYKEEGTGLHSQNRQKPAALPKSAFGSAKGNISSSVVHKVPDQVVMQGVGNYNFKYDCTASIGTEGVDTYAAGDVIQIVEDDMSLTLPINPCAVSSSGNASGTTTNVTFVYKGGL